MSLIIEGAEMPKSCGGCRASGTDVCKVWMKSKDLSVRHPGCPLQKIVTCKECGWSAYDAHQNEWNCNYNEEILVVPEDHYCGFGEREAKDGRESNNRTGPEEMA